MYHRRRKPRVDRVQSDSRTLFKLMTLKNRVFTAARDAVYRWRGVKEFEKSVVDIMEQPI